MAHTGAVFGASAKECGNYRELDMESARTECAAYLEILKNYKGDFSYES